MYTQIYIYIYINVYIRIYRQRYLSTYGHIQTITCICIYVAVCGSEPSTYAGHTNFSLRSQLKRQTNPSCSTKMVVLLDEGVTVSYLHQKTIKNGFWDPKWNKKQLLIFCILPDFPSILIYFGFILVPRADKGAFLEVKV